MIRAARASDLRDKDCKSPSRTLSEGELDRVLREISGTRAHLFEFTASHSRLLVHCRPAEDAKKLPRYSILFLGMQRCEASVHFMVIGAKINKVGEGGIDGSHLVFESNGGETMITSSDILIIIQDDEELLQIIGDA